MAITIVGKDISRAKRGTCRNCATVLEYFSIDVQQETHYDYGGGCDEYYFIICPCCGQKTPANKY